MKPLTLLSVNLGTSQPDPQDNGQLTGIYKTPAIGPAQLTALGLKGDAILDIKHHGGPDQAIYLYTQTDYDWWIAQLGRDLPPGTFGDNLTISGLESAALNAGDILQIGAVRLQVTSPRIPCGTFAARMDDPQFVKKFRQANRPGAYCRVLQPGPLCAGDEIAFEPYPGETLSLGEMFAAHYEQPRGEALLRRHLNAPISIRMREKYQKELEKYPA